MKSTANTDACLSLRCDFPTLLPALSRDFSTRFYPSAVKATSDVIRRWHERMSQSNSASLGTVPLYSDMQLLAMDAIIGMFVGDVEEMKKLRPKLPELLVDLNECVWFALPPFSLFFSSFSSTD